MQNWARNLTFSESEFLEIDSFSQLQEVVNTSSRVKVLATGHSFSPIADTEGKLISLKKLDSSIYIDSVNQTVSVSAGTSYAQLARYLEENGWALENLASLGEITIAGAIMTATHGSGSANSVLSNAVVEIEMVLASGEKLLLNEQNIAEFKGFIVSIGALAVFTRLKLRIVKSFSIKQIVYENITSKSVAQHFDEIFDAAYSVSYFNNWARDSSGQIWMKFLSDKDISTLAKNAFGGNLAVANQHPVKVNDPSTCTEQMGVTGKWLYRLPHFKLDSSPASGDEVQTEYLVDRKYVKEYIGELSAIGDEIASRVYATEIRTIKADDLWLSGAYQRPTVGFHFTWKKSADIENFLPKIEQILGQYNGRPHWGKLFSTDKDQLISRYPKFSDFQKLLKKYDPNGKFRNQFIDRYFY